MKLYRLLLLLLIPTLITLVSCGSDDDSSDSSINEEEATTGTTGTTTGTTTGGDGSSCMTATERNNIRTMWDRAALRGPINGVAIESFRNPDGTFDTETFPKSKVVVKKTSDNSWQSDSTFCVNEGEGCSSAQHVYSIAGTCYVEDGMTGNIRSTSSSRLSVRLTDTNTVPPLRQDSVYNFPGNNGRVRINTVYTLNGLRNSTFSFLEDSNGTSSSSSSSSTSSTTADAASTGASTGSSTGSSTGDSTGSSTGDTGSSGMGFGF